MAGWLAIQLGDYVVGWIIAWMVILLPEFNKIDFLY